MVWWFCFTPVLSFPFYWLIWSDCNHGNITKMTLRPQVIWSLTLPGLPVRIVCPVSGWFLAFGEIKNIGFYLFFSQLPPNFLFQYQKSYIVDYFFL